MGQIRNFGETEIDYEEGTWTPAWVGSSSTSGGGYSQQDGTFTKVGNLVNCQMATAFSSEPTMGGYIFLSGLPFATSVFGWTCPGNVFLFDGMGVTKILMLLQLTNGVTTAYLHAVNAAVATVPLPATTDMGSGTVMATSFSYTTAL
jgi:hypothetical protein